MAWRSSSLDRLFARRGSADKLSVTWTFERAGQKLRLEVHEIAGSGGWEMVLRQPNGATISEQFGRPEMLQSYLGSVQETLRELRWVVVGDDELPWRSNLVPLESRTGRAKQYAEHGAIKDRVGDADSARSDETTEPAEVYDLSDVQPDIPAEWKTAATYTLEFPAKCPHCREPLNALRVMKLKRSQVSFTSTLPRSGNVLVCPLCERIISAELSGLLS